MKPFKSLEEQVKILSDRDLNFSDINRAKRYLLEYNYYNVVNAYSKFFIDNQSGTYHTDVYFEDIIEIHHFDKEIKHAIFKGIIEAERHFKSILAYSYCEYFCNDVNAYLNAASYDNTSENSWKIPKLIRTLQNRLKHYKNHNNNNSIKHYDVKYSVVPFWVLVDYLTLGEVSIFYSLLPEKIKNTVAKRLSIFIKDNLNTNTVTNVHYNIIQKGVENLTDLRNITAHNNKLLGHVFKHDLPFYSDLHDFLSINKDDNRQNVYHTILFLQFFVSYHQYAQLHNTILKRMETLKKRVNDKYSQKVFHSLGLPQSLKKKTQ